MFSLLRQWKQVLALLAVFAFLVVGLTVSISVLAAPSVHPVTAPLMSGLPFEIVDHEPPTHAVGVDVMANITAAFDSAVNSSTVNTDTWVVHGMFGGLTTGTYMAGGPALAFDPDRNFFAGENVRVVATSEISSTSGVSLTSQQFSFTAGPVKKRCVASFEWTGSLASVYLSSVAWGDFDGDGDLDVLLTGKTTSSQVTRVYRNDINLGGTWVEQQIVHPGLTAVSSSSVAWGDYDNDGDLDILLTGNPGFGGGVSKIYRNDGETGSGWAFTDISAGLIGVYSSSVAWGDYDNDGDLDILLTGYNSGAYVTKVYQNNINTAGSFIEQIVSAPGLAGVVSGSVAWGDYDNDGDLDLLLTGSTLGSVRLAKLYRNDGAGPGSTWTFTDINAALSDVASGAVAWGDYDSDGDLDILLTGSSSGAISRIYRNDGAAPGSGWTFTDIAAGLAGVYFGSASWGDYDNDGDQDVLVTGYNGVASLARIYRNDGPAGSGWTFTDISAALSGVRNSSAAWGDYDSDGDLDILVTGEVVAGVSVARVYGNDDCADLIVTKQTSTNRIRPGEPLTFTVAFSNAGDSVASGVLITDSFPSEIALTGVTSSTTGGIMLMQTSDAPKLVWTATDMTSGDSGYITLTGVVDAGLTGSMVVTNHVTVTTSSSEPALVNNNDTASVNVVEPGKLTVTKVVVGPVPGNPWMFNGAPSPGAFQIPAPGGSQGFTLDPDVYTVTENLQPNYASAVSCTGGSQSESQASFTMISGANVTCTFTNTFTAHKLAVSTVGSGDVVKQPDQENYTHGEVVELTATANPGWTFTGWSGDATGSANPLNVTMDSSKSITATFTQDEYSLTIAVVGSGKVDKQPDQVTYVHGSIVDLTTDADAGWTFTGWSGDASGKANPLNVTMDSSKSITATFTQDKYSLTIAVVGSGKVDKQPDQVTYLHGAIVALTADADTGWTFSGWSGDAGGEANPLNVTMERAKAITATFTADGGETGATVLGKVVDKDNNGLESVRVTLTDGATAAQDALQIQDTTDASGEYRFEAVPAGAYTLTFTKQGYLTPGPIVLQIGEGEIKTIVPVIMQKEPSNDDETVFLPGVTAGK